METEFVIEFAGSTGGEPEGSIIIVLVGDSVFKLEGDSLAPSAAGSIVEPIGELIP